MISRASRTSYGVRARWDYVLNSALAFIRKRFPFRKPSGTSPCICVSYLGTAVDRFRRCREEQLRSHPLPLEVLYINKSTFLSVFSDLFLNISIPVPVYHNSICHFCPRNRHLLASTCLIPSSKFRILSITQPHCIS
jgi:hypothetical protein